MISFAVGFEKGFDGIRSSDRLMACIGGSQTRDSRRKGGYPGAYGGNPEHEDPVSFLVIEQVGSFT